LWPLVAIGLASQHTGQAAEYARRMLPPPQQLLPEPVRTMVENAVDTWDTGRPGEKEELLRQAIGRDDDRWRLEGRPSGPRGEKAIETSPSCAYRTSGPILTVNLLSAGYLHAMTGYPVVFASIRPRSRATIAAQLPPRPRRTLTRIS